LWDRLVDAIDFASELERVVLLLVCTRVEDLVDVLGARQAGDGDLGDVLGLLLVLLSERFSCGLTEIFQ
jgi:hypothetical protein